MKDIQFTVEDLIVQLKTFDDQLKKIQHNCIECFHFANTTYYCDNFKSQVPAKVIVTGCDNFKDIEVPF
jgi:hypothetical protein